MLVDIMDGWLGVMRQLCLVSSSSMGDLIFLSLGVRNVMANKISMDCVVKSCGRRGKGEMCRDPNQDLANREQRSFLIG